jgi:hypothetical protein
MSEVRRSVGMVLDEFFEYVGLGALTVLVLALIGVTLPVTLPLALIGWCAERAGYEIPPMVGGEHQCRKQA